MNKYTTFADEAAWLADRRTGIGASDIAAVLGLSPWKSPLALWREKVEDIPPSTSIRMRMGLAQEEPIREEYERDTGLAVLRLPRFHSFRDPEKPWLRCSVDGIVLSTGGEPARVLEIKTTSRPSDWRDEVPAYYSAQTQWEMRATRLPRTDLAIPLDGERLTIFEIEEDPAFQAHAEEQAERFMELVTAGTPPPPDSSESTREALIALYGRKTAGKLVTLPIEAMTWLVDRHAICAQLKELERRKDGIENLFRAALHDAEAGEVPGYGVVTHKIQRRKAYSVPAWTGPVLRFPRTTE